MRPELLSELWTLLWEVPLWVLESVKPAAGLAIFLEDSSGRRASGWEWAEVMARIAVLIGERAEARERLNF